MQAVASVDWVRGVAVVRGERARRAMVMRAKTIFAILVGVGERFLRGCEDLVAWFGVSWCERSGMSKGGEERAYSQIEISVRLNLTARARKLLLEICSTIVELNEKV